MMLLGPAETVSNSVTNDLKKGGCTYLRCECLLGRGCDETNEIGIRGIVKRAFHLVHAKLGQHAQCGGISQWQRAIIYTAESFPVDQKSILRLTTV